MSLGDQMVAAEAAKALRAWLSDPAFDAGERRFVHFDLARPRRWVWIEAWANLPGLMRDLGGTGEYTHALLPGWKYTPSEMLTEMIEDLERFAATGEQPKVATR